MAGLVLRKPTIAACVTEASPLRSGPGLVVCSYVEPVITDSRAQRGDQGRWPAARIEQRTRLSCTISVLPMWRIQRAPIR